MKWTLLCLLTRINRVLFHNHKWNRTLDIHEPVWPLIHITEIQICDCGATRFKENK